MRGYAPTAVPADGRYQTAALSLDALALADALAPADEIGPGDEAVLIGHDWGAICSYGAVVHRPERFRRMVTMSVPHRASLARLFATPSQLKRSWYMFFFQHPLAEMSVSADDFAFIDMLWRDWSPGFEPPAGHLQGLKESLASPGSLDAALSYYRHLLDPARHDPRLAEVEAAGGGWVPVPTLYLHGGSDGCIATEVLSSEEEMKALFPGGLELEVLPGLGHFLHLEDPAVVNRRIVEFLTRA
jgi:pimeloyl-ACP methyl ester carboxylesterase